MASDDTVNKSRGKVQRHRRELSSADAIAAARKAFRHREKFLFGVVGKLEAEFVELDLFTDAERNSAIDDALSEIKPQDRLGPRPPKNISVGDYPGKILYAFTWKSRTWGSIYFKFCLTGATDTEWLAIHSFHHERAKENDK